MNKYDYVIVGAGLFGAAFAQIMTERKKRCLVVEKRERVGGNAATEEVDGIIVHKFGPHIFHTRDKSVWEYVNRFAEFNNFIYSPLAESRGKLFNLPFNMNTFYSLWGVKTPSEARATIEQQIKAAGITDPKNLEEKALSAVGEDIYRTLVKGYAEKRWARDCRFLPASVIGKLDLRFSFDNSFFGDGYQGVPIGGYTRLVENMLDGAEVITGVDYFSDKAGFDGLAKTTVYTGPIDRYFNYALGYLDYGTFEFETERLELPEYQGVSAVFYTDFDVSYARIVEHKYFEWKESAHTVITREYPKKYEKGDEPLYPIPDAKNAELYGKYKELAEKEKSVLFGGRLAEYKYYSMGEVVARAMQLAGEL